MKPRRSTRNKNDQVEDAAGANRGPWDLATSPPSPEEIAVACVEIGEILATADLALRERKLKEFHKRTENHKLRAEATMACAVTTPEAYRSLRERTKFLPLPESYPATFAPSFDAVEADEPTLAQVRNQAFADPGEGPSTPKKPKKAKADSPLKSTKAKSVDRSSGMPEVPPAPATPVDTVESDPTPLPLDTTSGPTGANPAPSDDEDGVLEIQVTRQSDAPVMSMELVVANTTSKGLVKYKRGATGSRHAPIDPISKEEALRRINSGEMMTSFAMDDKPYKEICLMRGYSYPVPPEAACDKCKELKLECRMPAFKLGRRGMICISCHLVRGCSRKSKVQESNQEQEFARILRLNHGFATLANGKPFHFAKLPSEYLREFQVLADEDAQADLAFSRMSASKARLEKKLLEDAVEEKQLRAEVAEQEARAARSQQVVRQSKADEATAASRSGLAVQRDKAMLAAEAVNTVFKGLDPHQVAAVQNLAKTPGALQALTGVSYERSGSGGSLQGSVVGVEAVGAPAAQSRPVTPDLPAAPAVPSRSVTPDLPDLRPSPSKKSKTGPSGADSAPRRSSRKK